MTTQFTHKLVAVLNEKVESGVIMNALAHMSLGLGASIGKDQLRLSTYVDADANEHPHISEMPYIILKANTSKIRALRQQAIASSVQFVVFTDTMTGGGYLEQLENTKSRSEESLIYYGIALFGEWKTVTELTKKFSLWR